MGKQIFLLLCIIWQFSGCVVFAGQEENMEAAPQATVPMAVETALDYLFQALNEPQLIFDPTRATPLLAFSQQQGALPSDIVPKDRADSNGSFLSFSVNASIEKILHYLYNPDIPKFMVLPALLRLSGWHSGSDLANRKTPLWDHLNNLDSHLLLRGRKYEVNTPTSAAGGYYRYDLNRLVILMKHRGQPILVSVSNTSEPSSAGKKGVIIDDKNWNYFYSEIEGVSHNLIGWADTHIYHSASVIVYHPQAGNHQRTQITMFNWLKAGWKGVNVVSSDHIKDGCERFKENLTYIFDSPTLPETEALISAVRRINSLPHEALDQLARQYARAFEQKAQNKPKMKNEDFMRIIANGGYADVLTLEEKRGIVLQEYFKTCVGKHALLSHTQIETPDMQTYLSDAAPVSCTSPNAPEYQ
jgi:hypothetical protein